MMTERGGVCNPAANVLCEATAYRPWPGFRRPCQNDGLPGLA